VHWSTPTHRAVSAGPTWCAAGLLDEAQALVLDMPAEFAASLKKEREGWPRSSAATASKRAAR